MRLDEIRPNPDQPRKHFAEGPLQELAESIRELGLLQPIAVTSDGVIVAGERRWRASQMAGLTEIPVVVVDDDEARLFVKAVAENVNRADMTILEEIDSYGRLVDEYGMTVGEVAKLLGTNASSISWKLGMRGITDALRPVAATGQISPDMMWHLAQLEPERQMEVFRKWSAGHFANHTEMTAYCEAVKAVDSQEFMFNIEEIPEVTARQQRERDRTRNRLGMVGQAMEKLDEIFADDDSVVAINLGADAERLRIELEALHALIGKFKRRAVRIEQLVHAGIGQGRIDSDSATGPLG